MKKKAAYELPPIVMLDLESLDNTPTSVVLSIGAVCSLDVSRPFHVHLSLEDQVAHGCTISTSTVLWWLGMNATARGDQTSVPAEQRMHPAEAMEAFAEWINSFDCYETIEIWGNGAAFDEPIIHNQMRIWDVAIPYKFWNVKCYRTLKGLYPSIEKASDNQHTALGDALNQMSHLVDLLEHHNIPF
jgi:hypothetical protein